MPRLVFISLFLQHRRVFAYLLGQGFLPVENVFVDDELPEGVLEHVLPGILLQAAVGAEGVQADGLGTVHRPEYIYSFTQIEPIDVCAAHW